MTKFESNTEGPAPPNNILDRFRKDTCGKNRVKYRGEAMPEFDTANAKDAPSPQPPSGP